MTYHDLPPINASLNALATLFIAAGWWLIRHDRTRLHIIMMICAVVTSTAFLACYLTYHFGIQGAVTRFPDIGWVKNAYLILLLTHVLLAFAVPPLVILSLVPALRARYDRHRRIGRWTMPIWLYVSVTGVLVYFMLYQWFPASRYAG